MHTHTHTHTHITQQEQQQRQRREQQQQYLQHFFLSPKKPTQSTEYLSINHFC